MQRANPVTSDLMVQFGMRVTNCLLLDWEVRLDCWHRRSHIYSGRKLGGLQSLRLRPKLPAGRFGGRLNENNLLQGRSTAKLNQAICVQSLGWRVLVAQKLLTSGLRFHNLKWYRA